MDKEVCGGALCVHMSHLGCPVCDFTLSPFISVEKAVLPYLLTLLICYVSLTYGELVTAKLQYRFLRSPPSSVPV
ncbi:hypothetical protein [Porphyromonas pogonae]|uniref:hypothetical protein n=1 Tax=Porphyromonas pogonae TaxID=867595 RepID=UPI00300E94D6